MESLSTMYLFLVQVSKRIYEFIWMRNSILIIILRAKNPKAMKGIGVIKRLSKMLPQQSLLTIYKSFVQPHLDYGDILINQTIKGYFKKLRLFNTMLHWPLLVPSQVHLKLNFTMN